MKVGELRPGMMFQNNFNLWVVVAITPGLAGKEGCVPMLRNAVPFFRGDLCPPNRDIDMSSFTRVN